MTNMQMEFNAKVEELKLSSFVFPFVPEKSLPRKVVCVTNYEANKAASLLEAIPIPQARKAIEQLTYEMSDRDKLLTISNCFNHHRLIFNTDSVAFAIINLNQLEGERKFILEGGCNSVYGDVNDLFYTVYLMETRNLIKVMTENGFKYAGYVDAESFRIVANLTTQEYLDTYKEDRVSFVFSYFFMRFTNAYDFLGINLTTQRMELLKGMARVAGFGY